MRLELTEIAEADYCRIVEYSYSEFGEQIANHYADSMDENFARLIDHPQIGRRELRLRGDIRSISCRSHRIYYTIDENMIVVRRILHKSMDAGAWLG